MNSEKKLGYQTKTGVTTSPILKKKKTNEEHKNTRGEWAYEEEKNWFFPIFSQ